MADSCVDSLVSCAETLVSMKVLFNFFWFSFIHLSFRLVTVIPTWRLVQRRWETKTKPSSFLTTIWTTPTPQSTLTRWWLKDQGLARRSLTALAGALSRRVKVRCLDPLWMQTNIFLGGRRLQEGTEQLSMELMEHVESLKTTLDNMSSRLGTRSRSRSHSKSRHSSQYRPSEQWGRCCHHLPFFFSYYFSSSRSLHPVPLDVSPALTPLWIFVFLNISLAAVLHTRLEQKQEFWKEALRCPQVPEVPGWSKESRTT